MPNDRTPVQSPDPGVGPPPRDRENDRSLDILHTEVAKIQVDGEYTKKFLAEQQGELRELRDRLIALEVNVTHLPSKEFIIKVVSVALLIGGMIATALFGLQAYLSGQRQPPAPIQSFSPPPAPPVPPAAAPGKSR